MRDIREDLIERLEAVNAELASAKTEYDVARRRLEQDYGFLFQDINARQQAISTLLETEAKRLGMDPPRRAPSPPALRLPLVDFIFNAVGAGSRSKEDLRDMAERSGYENAGRTLHTTLMNMVRSGKLTVNDDVYRLTGLVVPLDGAIRNRENLDDENEDDRDSSLYL